MPKPTDYYCVLLEVEGKRRFVLAIGNNAAFICPICGGLMIANLNPSTSAQPTKNKFCCQVTYKVHAKANKIGSIEGVIP